MQYKDMSLEQFTKQTASNSPVPGGGSVSALCAALSVSLAQMVTALTAGKKNYEAVTPKMEKIGRKMEELQNVLLAKIDEDSNAFDTVMAAFKLPKITDEEKALRRQAIEKATVFAAEVPLSLAEDCCSLFDDFAFVAQKGNKNALSDIAVATMLLRTAVLGALYNVKINLGGLPESEYKQKTCTKVEKLEAQAIAKEKEILSYIVL